METTRYLPRAALSAGGAQASPTFSILQPASQTEPSSDSNSPMIFKIIIVGIDLEHIRSQQSSSDTVDRN